MRVFENFNYPLHLAVNSFFFILTGRESCMNVEVVIDYKTGYNNKRMKFQSGL